MRNCEVLFKNFMILLVHKFYKRFFCIFGDCCYDDDEDEDDDDDEEEEDKEKVCHGVAV